MSPGEVKSPLINLIERAAFEQGQRKCASMAQSDVAAARLDGWQDEAIEACVDFGLIGPDAPGADEFVTAFVSGADRRAEDDGIEPEQSGCPTI